MKKGKRVAAVCLYLALISLFLGLRPRELLDLRQLLLVLAGGVILYLSGMEKEDFKRWKEMDFELFARNVVYASFLETFVLLFIMLSHGETAGRGNIEEYLLPSMQMRNIAWNIALNLRPLLYGVCIWIVLGGDVGRGTEEEKKTWTAQEAYQRFLDLGLTRREAEIAVQIGKGFSNKEIAMELNISETTVKKHVSNIFEKLGVEKRQEIRERLTL